MRRTNKINRIKKYKITNKKRRNQARTNKLRIHKRKITHRNKRQSGGNNYDQKIQELKKLNIFRGKFRELILPLIGSSGLSKNKTKEVINRIKQFFSDNNELINTLIPINVERVPVLSKITDYVPIPTIILDNITNNDTKKRLLLIFYENGGNINATNQKGRKIKQESAFAHAVDTKQMDNINILLEEPFHLTRDNLPDRLKEEFDLLMAAPIVEEEPMVEEDKPMVEEENPIVEEETPIVEEDKPMVEEDKPIVEEENAIVVEKLTIPSRLPNMDVGYDATVAPEFWKPIFDNRGDNLLELRNNIRNWVSEDTIENVLRRYSSDRRQNSWSTCAYIESMFSAYSTKTTPEYGRTTNDFINMNTSLCIMLILFGIISYKMIGQDYNFIFKGGKAVQFVLSEIPTSKYISDDIDILVMPNDSNAYNKDNVENLSVHIGLLIQWFLKDNLNISIEVPDTKLHTIGKDIVKLAIRDSLNKYNALSDIGFGKIKDDIKTHFMHPQEFRMYSNKLNQHMLFRCPNIESIINEKLHYFLKFVELKDMLKNNISIPYPEYENITENDLNYFMIKFKRSIKALIDGLIIQDFGNIKYDEIREHERLMLINLLSDFEANIEYKIETSNIISNPNMYDV